MNVDHILVVDGNSSDSTATIAKHSGATVIMQNGSGKGSALRQAFSSVDGEIVVFMDADGSMLTEEIPHMVQTLEQHPEIDIVKGSRFLQGGYSEDMTFMRRIGNKLFVWIVNHLWSTQYTDLCYGFGAFRQEALTKLLPHLKSQNFEIETEICIKAKRLGLEVIEVPSVERRRQYGKSHLGTFRDGARILKRMLKEFMHAHS